MITMTPQLRRFATAALIFTGAALAGAVYAAIASATWDVEAYDECLKTTQTEYQCCLASGGEWDGGPNFNTVVGTCRAPAPEAQGSTETSTPPPKSVLPTVTGVQPPNIRPTLPTSNPPTTAPPTTSALPRP